MSDLSLKIPESSLKPLGDSNEPKKTVVVTKVHVVRCARCRTLYEPCSSSSLFGVSKAYTERTRKTFVASVEEPKTGFVWCPTCFVDFAEKKREPKEESKEEQINEDEIEVILEHHNLSLYEKKGEEMVEYLEMLENMLVSL